MHTLRHLALAALVLCLAGCKSEQQAAFDEATALTQEHGDDALPRALAAFEKVVALNASTPLAAEARIHIAELQKRVAEAEQRHKDVFQEHGVD